MTIINVPTNLFSLLTTMDKTLRISAVQIILCGQDLHSDVGLNVIGVTGWGGNRTTKNLPNLFPDYTGTVDKRANFFGTGRKIEIVDRIADGYAVTKFKNLNRDGSLGYQLKDLGVGIDMPLFRLAEQYLIYAEAVLRGGTGGDPALAAYLF